MKKGVSVIVCCYNSELRLPNTLRFISQQKVNKDLLWEVLVIDNKSTDNTNKVAVTEWSRFNCKTPFKVIYEPKAGLSNARKTGVLNSQYEYVIFCDDDNWLCKEYVQVAYNIINSNPQIGMLGGRCDAVSEIELPVWFNEMKYAYAIGTQGSESGDISLRGFMWGAGVVVKANVLRSIYQYNIHSLLLGREGKLLNAGDDAEISCWFLMLGYRLWYDDRLYFKHFIAKERLSENYVKGLVAGFDRSTPVMSSYYRIIDYQKDFGNKTNVHVLIKSIYKFLLIKLRFLPYKDSLPRIKENIQISSNSFISFNHNIKLVQRQVFNRLLKLKDIIF